MGDKGRAIVISACIFLGAFFTSMSSAVDDVEFKPSHIMAALAAATIALGGHLRGLRAEDPWRSPNERAGDIHPKE